MVLQELGQVARDVLTVRQVFADPVERDGVTLVPVARVGGGGGGGRGPGGGEEGEGGGLGMVARPVGAFVMAGGTVTWRPAVDVNRVVTAAAAVLCLALLRRRRRRG